jgi:hypothetical protein
MAAKSNIPRGLAAYFGERGEAQWVPDREHGFLLRTKAWHWSFEQIRPPPAVSAAFKGEMFEAFPEVCVEGGAGLRSRLFAVTADRTLSLDDPDDMRWFLERYVSREDPVELADLLERCQGRGRVANIYLEDEGLERHLNDDAHYAVMELGLTGPVMKGDELTFYAWQIVMAARAEVVVIDKWALSMGGPNGPEWRSTRLPVQLPFGSSNTTVV